VYGFRGNARNYDLNRDYKKRTKTPIFVEILQQQTPNLEWNEA
jgi:hypothetical protein